MSAELDSWYHEKESAWLYRQVAGIETDPRKRRLFEQLAQAAETQAKRWEVLNAAKPGAAGTHHAGPAREFQPALRARIVVGLVRRFGPRAMRGVLAAMKLRGLSVYSAPPVAPGHPMPTSLAEVGARHRSTVGGNLRAAVFGVN